MSTIDNETVDSPNDAVDETETDVEETDVEETDTDTNEGTQDEPVEGEDDVARLKEQNKKLFERAKKAEGFVKDRNGNWVKKTEEKPKSQPKAPATAPKEEITAKDAIVLMKAGVDSEEDIDEVVRYAKFENISVVKALESKILKTILSNRKEERETAEATHTGGGKRGVTKASDDTLVQNADKGIYPDDPAELARARLNKRLGKKN